MQRNLVVRCPAADLFGIKGRAWLAEQDLPPDEQAAATALLRQLDFHADELALIDQDLARVALRRDDVRRLMTIPGVDATVALSILAAVGDFARFHTPERLVSYLGFNPRARQSANQPANHGRQLAASWPPRGGSTARPQGVPQVRHSKTFAAGRSCSKFRSVNLWGH